MVEAITIMGVMGVIVGIGLAAASKVFYVYVDPQVLAVDDALPGANCGGCGYPGCGPNAEAIVAGKSSPSSCVAAGSDVAEAIAAIMGLSVEAKEPDIAKPGCTYGVADAETKYIYDGLSDCRAAALLSGGMKVCSIGCLGLGSCVKACQFNALSMGPDGLPVVNENRCTGCGACDVQDFLCFGRREIEIIIILVEDSFILILSATRIKSLRDLIFLHILFIYAITHNLSSYI